MKPTPRTRLILAGAGGLILAAVLSLTVTPAALGLAALLYLVHTRLAARRAFQATNLQVERRIPQASVHAGQVFEVELDATASQVPAGLRVTLEDQLPEAFSALEGTMVVGAVTRRYPVIAQVKGGHTFHRTTARLEDPWGLWQHETTLPLVTQLRVLPRREAIEAGKRLARLETVEITTKDQLGTLIRELEFESFREYSPGDRLRDVDWKRYAKLKRLITKAWEKETEAELLLLVDAGRTMRAQHGPISKLDHASNLALELGEAAIARGYPVGYLAFDEVKVVDQIRPARDPRLPQRLAERVSELPGRVLTRRRLDVGLPGEAVADEREVDFLSTLAELTQEAPASRTGSSTGSRTGSSAGSSTGSSAGSSTGSRTGAGPGGADLGLGRAVARLLQHAGQDRLFVVLFTDLERVPDSTLKHIGQLATRRHRVITVLLPGSRFLSPPETPRVRDLENAYREVASRQRARKVLEARGVQLVEIGPEQTAATIVRASQDGPAQPRRGGGG